MAKVVFTGGKDLERELLRLSAKVAKSISRKALRKAARPILVEARNNVPVREGRLKKALRLKVDRGRDAVTGANQESATISLGGAAAKKYRPSKTDRARYKYQIGSRPDVYGAFVEFGTVDTAPQPYLRPAWDSHGGETALDAIGRELGNEIEREAGK